MAAPGVRVEAQRTLDADPHAYTAHPHAIRSGGEMLVVYNRAPRRGFVLHPPEDPAFVNVLRRSADDGASFGPAVAVPDHGWSGVECAGLTALGGGRVLLNQWRFRWHTLPLAQSLHARLGAACGLTFPQDLAARHAASAEHEGGPGDDPAVAMPWARGGGTAWVHRSDDGGRTWPLRVVLPTQPEGGGYGMRGGVVLPNGTLVLPLSDVPEYRRVYVLRSTDAGARWGALVTVADIADRLFEEPAPLLLPSGRILLLLRENRSRRLWRSWSDDGGGSWAAPEPTSLDGYPGHLLALADGRLLCTFGFRRPPFAIRAALSSDGGTSWGPWFDVRTGLPGRDLGYPCTLQRADGGLLTVYYARDAEGVTGIRLTDWRLGD